MQQLQKMQSQPAQSMLKSTPLRMSMPHVNQSVLLNKNYPWTTISNSWSPLPCLLTFKKVQSQPGRSMLKSTPLRIAMFHVNQGVLVINLQCLLCNFPIVIKLIMFQIIISVIQPPFKNYLTASVVIGQELSFDNNIELLISPSLSVNFQATCTKIEFLALCFHFVTHLFYSLSHSQMKKSKINIK